MKKFFTAIALFTAVIANAQKPEQNLAPQKPMVQYKATEIPSRIMLTWGENNPATQTVTWRTGTTVAKAVAEIALVTKDVDYYKEVKTYSAVSTPLKAIDENVLYHTVTFKDLKPETQYAYRVGGNGYWSEWISFKTAEAAFTKPFEFIYMGDAQNDVYALWSRVVRNAFAKAPQARFMLHAGDLINHSQNNYEWGEWFEAGNFIFKSIPQIAIAGNHEYIKNANGVKEKITPLWQPQFNFPKNGPSGLDDMAYYTDYLNCLIIALNSNEKFEQQAVWLDKVLKENIKEWVIVTFHHPVISAAEGRINEGVMNNWKPILDKYKVDMVLQGHDHVYGRGNSVNSGLGKWDENSGSVYVVSIAGRKSYKLSNHSWMQKKGENMQLYQIISIDKGRLTYKAYTADNVLFDAFTLDKVSGQPNKLTEITVTP